VRLSGKNALVTGTSRGIGPAIASALAAEGARVLCHARSEADARARAEELGGVAIFGELATEDGIASIAGQAIAAAPELHVLVHNAAINPRGHEPFDEVEREIFEQVLRVNVFAPLFLTQALLQPLRAAGSARVIILSSGAGQFGDGTTGDGLFSGDSLSYRVSKAAVNAVTAVAAAALRQDGILVNSMNPGWVRTDMGGQGATLSPEQGADTALHLATLPDDGRRAGSSTSVERSAGKAQRDSQRDRIRAPHGLDRLLIFELDRGRAHRLVGILPMSVTPFALQLEDWRRMTCSGSRGRCGRLEQDSWSPNLTRIAPRRPERRSTGSATARDRPKSRRPSPVRRRSRTDAARTTSRTRPDAPP
jgi:NAD(P)-dependent dehydrogenase (short-subunit alcohol dehydrogenase family)